MIARSRALRRTTTFPERLLWKHLRDCRCYGLRIRRQQPIGPYVVDFLCAEPRLIIELDGRSHNEQPDRDEQRQAYLEAEGFKVIRFTNDRLLRDLTGVLNDIAVETGEEIS